MWLIEQKNPCAQGLGSHGFVTIATSDVRWVLGTVCVEGAEVNPAASRECYYDGERVMRSTLQLVIVGFSVAKKRWGGEGFQTKSKCLLQRYLLIDMQFVLLLEGAMMSQTASGANVELLQSLKRVIQSSLGRWENGHFNYCVP